MVIKQEHIGLSPSKLMEISQQLRDEAQLCKDSEQRGDLFKEALDYKMQADWTKAARHGKGTTPFDVFCETSSIPHAFAIEIMEQLARYTQRDSAKKTSVGKQISELRKNKPVTFSREEAVAMVARAFTAFDPNMGKIVTRAFEQGRIRFTCLLDRGPYCSLTDEDKKLTSNGELVETEQRTRQNYGLAYAYIPLQSERLTIQDLYSLAHECGHLVAYDKYYAFAKWTYGHKFSPLYEPALHETFALLGQRIFYDYLMEHGGLNAQQRVIAKDYWEGDLEANLFYTAKLAVLERAISDLYSVNGCARLIKSPDKEKIDEVTQVLCNKAASWHDITGSCFDNLSYPFGLIASQAIFKQWKKGNPEKKRIIAELWSEIAQEGDGMNFMQAMHAMGIHYDDSTIVSSLSRAIREYETHQHTVRKELDALTSLKERQGQVIKQIATVPEKKRGTERMGMNTAHPPITTLGSIASGCNKYREKTDKQKS